jgi:hypothetical protein
MLCMDGLHERSILLSICSSSLERTASLYEWLAACHLLATIFTLNRPVVMKVFEHDVVLHRCHLCNRSGLAQVQAINPCCAIVVRMISV